ncbi:hypothetical protein BKI52_16535 [marine bacterium AO1-C]|nr:hypothetical protein BKI52_16535 [marine bacterium AO1-C]
MPSFFALVNMDLINNIELIINPYLDCEQIMLNGVKLGDTADKIALNAYEKLHVKYWLQNDLPFSYRLSEEKTPRVIEFMLKSKALEPLGITQESDIQGVFGEAQGMEKRMGSHYYFYSNKQMVVGWNAQDDKLWGIYLGDNIIEQTTYQAKDFLTLFFEFKGMVPKPSEWGLESLTGNEPRYYRLMQLQALMRAFDLGEDLFGDFQNRLFLEKRSHDDFEDLFADIEQYALENEFERKKLSDSPELIRKQTFVEMIFQTYLNFSWQVRTLLSFNSGWLETGSISSRYTIHKTHELLKSIDITKLEAIDHILCSIIDPQQRTYTKSELIRNYGFPDVDLDDIDMEYY